MSDEEKYVDESWKDSIAQEKMKEPEVLVKKDEEKEPLSKESLPTEINFLDYITSLAFQAMIFLGEVPHPATNAVEKDLRQAKVLIDTLLLLRGKTKGNLSPEENDTLNAALYELQMRFVELAQKKGTPQ